jgi:hypothetical protein
MTITQLEHWARSLGSKVIAPPQSFVIPDKRSADPEPMPWTVVKQFWCKKSAVNRLKYHHQCA